MVRIPGQNLLTVILILVCAIAAGQYRVFPSEESRLVPEFERLGPFGGEVRSLLIDAKDTKVIYIGTSDGRIFKSQDDGASWNPLVLGIGRHRYVIDTLVQHPVEHKHIYAGAWDLRSSGGGLFESKDAGATWTQVALPESSPAVRDLAICNAKPAYMIAGTLAGAYVSNDGGHEWKAVGPQSSELQKIESVTIDPADPRYLFAGTWRLGYRSSDFGKTWLLMDQGMILDSDVLSLCIDSRSPETMYASACTGIYRSTNRASSWTRLKVIPGRMAIRTQVVYVDAADSHRIYAGTTEGLFVSQDDGEMWRRITSSRLTINAIQVDPTNSRKILLGTDREGVLISEDGGQNWRESNRGFVRCQVTRIFPDPLVPGRFCAGIMSNGDKGGFYLFDSDGARWTPLTGEIVTGAQEFAFLSLPGRLGRLVGLAKGIYWQRPAERTWVKLSGPISGRTVYDLVLDPAGLWAIAGTDERIYRARADRLQFQKPSDARFSPKVNSLVVANAVTAEVYAGTSAGMFRTLDHGESWQAVAISGMPSGVEVECLAICPSDKDHLFAGTSAGLYESLDGGVTWLRANDGQLGVEVPSVIFLDFSGKKVLAADSTFGGIFSSEDGGQNWTKILAPGYVSPVRYLAQDRVRPDLIYIGTQSDGVYRLRFHEGSPTAGSH
jgi:photosystem II stability/assembly factor-like uncharacterized protein